MWPVCQRGQWVGAWGPRPPATWGAWEWEGERASGAGLGQLALTPPSQVSLRAPLHLNDSLPAPANPPKTRGSSLLVGRRPGAPLATLAPGSDSLRGQRSWHGMGLADPSVQAQPQTGWFPSSSLWGPPSPSPLRVPAPHQALRGRVTHCQGPEGCRSRGSGKKESAQGEPAPPVPPRPARLQFPFSRLLPWGCLHHGALRQLRLWPLTAFLGEVCRPEGARPIAWVCYLSRPGVRTRLGLTWPREGGAGRGSRDRGRPRAVSDSRHHPALPSRPLPPGRTVWEEGTLRAP